MSDRKNTEISTIIRMIPTEAISPHPDNPRKDLGDLTELADSIKANGILQNLTVVPGEPGPENIPQFTVIIGHRRLAAAKLTGLDTVPCVIANLTPQEQIAMMLTENMQRSDLTVYEQAQGFQMMLDLGETVESVAKKSGFSQTTIRRRVKLLELDQEKFKASELRGGTLSDYMELDKISDPDTRNKVLDTIGTQDFRNELKKAIAAETKETIIAGYANALSVFAVKIDSPDWTSMEIAARYNAYNETPQTVTAPDDMHKIKYYYAVDTWGVTLYKDKNKGESNQERQEEIQKRERREQIEKINRQLEEITERHFQLRKDFISGFHFGKKNGADMMLFTADSIIYSGLSADINVFAEIIGFDTDEIDTENERDDCQNPLESIENLMRYFEADGRHVSEKDLLLYAVYAALDNSRRGYYTWSWHNDIGAYEYSYKEAHGLDRLYDFLIDLGYEMSDEEREMQSGTHELFTAAKELFAQQTAEN